MIGCQLSHVVHVFNVPIRFNKRIGTVVSANNTPSAGMINRSRT